MVKIPSKMGNVKHWNRSVLIGHIKTIDSHINIIMKEPEKKINKTKIHTNMDVHLK